MITEVIYICGAGDAEVSGIARHRHYGSGEPGRLVSMPWDYLYPFLPEVLHYY